MDCSGNWTPGSASPATCVTRPSDGWCYLEPYSVYVPAWICLARECDINNQPGVQCRWTILFGEGYTANIVKCAAASDVCF